MNQPVHSIQHVANTKVILHVSTGSMVADVINGRPYKLQPFEPVELPTFAANAIIRHIGHLYGIVEVAQTRTKTGVVWDVDAAMEEAEKYLHKCERDIVDFYVRQQLEERTSKGQPALPPTGRALEVVLSRKINLATQYGIRPVGWTDPGQLHPNEFGNGETSESSNEIASLKKQLTDLQGQFSQLMKVLNPPADDEPADNKQS